MFLRIGKKHFHIKAYIYGVLPFYNLGLEQLKHAIAFSATWTPVICSPHKPCTKNPLSQKTHYRLKLNCFVSLKPTFLSRRILDLTALPSSCEPGCERPVGRCSTIRLLGSPKPLSTSFSSSSISSSPSFSSLSPSSSPAFSPLSPAASSSFFSSAGFSLSLSSSPSFSSPTLS